MTLVFSDAVFISSQTPDPLTLPWGCKSLLGEAKTKKAQSRTVISEVLRKPSLGISRRCSRRGPAHLITAGQMKESNLLEKRSLKGGFDRQSPGPRPHREQSLLRASRARPRGPLPQGRRCALGRETGAPRGPGTPRAPAHPPSQSGGGARRSPASTTPAPDLPRCAGGGEVSGVRG